MHKGTNFSGQPLFNQYIKFKGKGDVKQIAKQHKVEKYEKKFSTYNHVLVMLFLEGYHSIREFIIGLSSHK